MHVEENGTRRWFDVDGPALVPDGPEMRERPTVVLLHGAREAGRAAAVARAHIRMSSEGLLESLRVEREFAGCRFVAPRSAP